MVCHCADGWICEQHPDRPWPHDDCVGPGMVCRNPGCVIGRVTRAEPEARRTPDFRLVYAATAAAFAVATAYGIWRIEWFDVFRWGLPSARLTAVYACYMGIGGAVGWFLSALLVPRKKAR